MRVQAKPALLGAADGVTSISGVVAAAGATSSANHTAVVAIAGALSATISMAGAELISEDEIDYSSVGSMALGTALGSALPVVPLLFIGGTVGWIAVGLVALVIACAVAEVRTRVSKKSRTVDYAITIALVGAGSVVGYLLGAM